MKNNIPLVRSSTIWRVAIPAFILLLGITTVTAMSIDFYYSDSCPYCQKMKPILTDYENQMPDKTFNWLNLDEEENVNEFRSKGFTGVPVFIINSCDAREIIIQGADEKRLKCELEEVSSLDCPTSSADMSVGGSWFRW